MRFLSSWRALTPLLVAALVVTGATALAEQRFNAVRLLLPDTVRIGVNGSLPGWSYPRDSPAGFDVALGDYLAARYGVRVRYEPLDPGEREDALLNDRVDLVIANYSIDGSSTATPTQSRTDVLDFAGPYFEDNSGVTYSEAKLRRYQAEHPDFDRDVLPPERICTSTGTTATDYLATAHREPSQERCFEKFVDDGDPILGVVTDEGILVAYTHEKNPAAVAGAVMWKGASQPIQAERYGIAMRKGRTALCRELDRAVTDFIGDGEHSPWEAAFDDHLADALRPQHHRPEGPEPDLCR